MKKNLKRLFVLFLVLLQLFVLCGCSALDEMREMQAFLNEDGTITWQGNIYKKIPYNEYLDTSSASESPVFVTKSDVPVLLSTTFSVGSFYASEDKTFLTDFYAEEGNYCLASKYEEICARIKAAFVPEIVCYQYSFYNEETGMFESKYYTLTQEQTNAIKLVMETVEPTVFSDGMHLDTMFTVFLEECSADMLFRRNTVDLSLSENGKTYYISLYTDTGELLFTVPEGCNAAFDGIFKAVVDNAEPFLDGDLPLI